MLPSKAVGSYPTFSTSPQPSPEGEGGRQLFSVALSVISTYFSALVEIPPLIAGCIALYCPDFPPNWKR